MGSPSPVAILTLAALSTSNAHATDPFLEPEPKTKQTNRKISNAHHSTKTHGATQHGTHTGRHTAVGELAEAGVGLVHVDDLRVVGEVAAVCAGDEADEGEEEEEEEEEDRHTRWMHVCVMWTVPSCARS